MNVSVEQAISINDLSSRLDNAHDLLVKSAKIASIIGAVCGFIYLLSYTTHVGIPFPLELSVLPTTLLIVGLTSVIGTFIIMAGVFVPALTLDYNDQVTKNYRRADDQRADVMRARFIRYFSCTWAPTVLALLGFISLLGIPGHASFLELGGGAAIFISACWIFYTPKYVGVFLENRWQYLFVNCLQVFLSIFAYSLIIFISVAVYPDLGQWPAWIGCLIALLIFTLFQILIFVPAKKSENNESQPPADVTTATTPVMRAIFVLAAVWTATTLMMPQVNYKIGSAALRAFHVGGDVPVAICLKSKPAALISERFAFDADYCSKKLSLKLDSGDRVYVSKFASKIDSPLLKDISQEEAVYFRQDEIKQKIYFR